MPGSGLEADLSEGPDRNEAHGAMQADASLVGKRDPRDRRVESLLGQDLQQPGVEGAADTAAVGVRRGVDGRLD